MRQVKRLLRNIYKPQHYYYIHVDQQSEYMYQELSYLEAYPNIKFSKMRYRTFWASNTILFMLLNAIKEMISHGWNFDYVMNISESDFQVRPMEQFEEHLRKRNGLNFLSMGINGFVRFQESQGMNRIFYNCDEHMFKMGDR